MERLRLRSPPPLHSLVLTICRHFMSSNCMTRVITAHESNWLVYDYFRGWTRIQRYNWSVLCCQNIHSTAGDYHGAGLSLQVARVKRMLSLFESLFTTQIWHFSGRVKQPKSSSKLLRQLLSPLLGLCDKSNFESILLKVASREWNRLFHRFLFHPPHLAWFPSLYRKLLRPFEEWRPMVKSFHSEATSLRYCKLKKSVQGQIGAHVAIWALLTSISSLTNAGIHDPNPNCREIIKTIMDGLGRCLFAMQAWENGTGKIFPIQDMPAEIGFGMLGESGFKISFLSLHHCYTSGRPCQLLRARNGENQGWAQGKAVRSCHYTSMYHDASTTKYQALYLRWRIFGQGSWHQPMADCSKHQLGLTH